MSIDAFGVERGGIAKAWDAGEKSSSGSRGVMDNAYYNRLTRRTTQLQSQKAAIRGGVLGGLGGAAGGLVVAGPLGALAGAAGGGAIGAGAGYAGRRLQLKRRFSKPRSRTLIEGRQVRTVAAKTGAKVNEKKWGDVKGASKVDLRNVKV